MKVYTKKEIEYLKENYGKMSIADLAEQMDRDVQSVYKKAQRMELTNYVPTRKSKDTLCWTCAFSTGGCSWSRKENPEPIPGWDATPSDVSYIVGMCPLYEKDESMLREFRKSELKSELIMDLRQVFDGISPKEFKDNWLTETNFSRMRTANSYLLTDNFLKSLKSLGYELKLVKIDD